MALVRIYRLQKRPEKLRLLMPCEQRRSIHIEICVRKYMFTLYKVCTYVVLASGHLK